MKEPEKLSPKHKVCRHCKHKTALLDKFCASCGRPQRGMRSENELRMQRQVVKEFVEGHDIEPFILAIAICARKSIDWMLGEDEQGPMHMVEETHKKALEFRKKL